jgi:hypothetical protein
MLPSLRQYDFTPLSIPVTANTVSPDKPILQDAHGKQLSRTRISSLLFRYSAQVYGMGMETRPVSSVVIWNYSLRQLDSILKMIKIADRRRKSDYIPIFRLLKRLSGSIDPSAEITVSHVHGMVTPWTMHYSELRLFAQVWETRSNAVPVFFDQFHHMFCELVVREQKDAQAWFTFTRRSFDNLAQRRLAHRLDVDMRTHFSMYVLFMTANHLRHIMAQQSPSTTDLRLLRTWTDMTEGLLTGNFRW